MIVLRFLTRYQRCGFFLKDARIDAAKVSRKSRIFADSMKKIIALAAVLDCGKEYYLDNDIKRIMTKNVSSGYYLTYTLASYFNVAAKD